MIRTELALEDITPKDIMGFIKKHKEDDKYLPRYEKLSKYYEAEHTEILSEPKNEDKPDSRLINSYARYIVDMNTGYLVGNPINYKLTESTDSTTGEELMERLTELYDHNDEQELNTELAKTSSKLGVAYELQYVDDNGEHRLIDISPLEAFTVHDKTIEKNIVLFIRYYPIEKGIEVEVYTKDDIIRLSQADSSDLSEVERKPHKFGDVPVSIYSNNREMICDFEQVVSLIDSYDKAQSDTMNDMDQFTDAYMVIEGIDEIAEGKATEMKKDRIILTPEGCKAEWMVKSVNDTWVENFKTRIRQDIHKFSYTPDLSDSDFAGNLSGVALAYKLLPFENNRKNKARKFKAGLQRRMKLACNYMGFTSNSIYEYSDIEVNFDNTLPQNLKELSEIILNLSDLLSKDTRLSLLPFIENSAKELKKKEKEMEFDSYENFMSEDDVEKDQVEGEDVEQ